MKVCFMSFSSTTNQDGASLSMLNIAKEMAKRGIEVVLVLSTSNNLEMIENVSNIEVVIMPTYNMRVNIAAKNRMTNLKFSIKYLLNSIKTRKLYGILKDKKIDCIHINGLNHQMGAQIANKLNIPYVWHIRQLLEEDLGQTLFNKKKIWKYVNKSNYIIAISNIVKEKFEKELLCPIKVIYNGVPIEQYKVEDHTIFCEGEIKLLLPGRISEGKGQIDAIKAVKILHDEYKIKVSLLIVGNVENKEYESILINYINDNNMSSYVTIKEYISDLREVRSKYDIGLTCSKNEAFGRVTIENQLAGMLVIGANKGGTLEIIKDHETGLFYKEGDYSDLALKVLEAVNNKDLMRVIANKGYCDAINYYSIGRVVDEVLEVYKEIQVV